MPRTSRLRLTLGRSPAAERTDPLLTARQAAARLGVKQETLYAYVARGLIESRAGDGPGRARRYSAVEIEAFIARRRGWRDPEAAAAGALFWGLPVVESAISSVDGVHLAYRGRDAVALSRNATFEEVAALLWSSDGDGAGPWPGVADDDVADAVRAARALPPGAPPRDVLQVLVASLAVRDLERFETGAEAVRRTARRLVERVVAAFARVAAADGATAASTGPMAGRVLAALGGRPGGERDVDRALVLSAEHELNASSFAARVAASTGADPYSVVLGAMATLGGPRHGGLTDRVEAIVRRMCALHQSAEAALDAWPAGDEAFPGFGHPLPLYRRGDPRTAPLLDAARAGTATPELETLLDLVDAMAGRGGPSPTVDLGLVATCLSLGLPAGSAGILFAFGRTAGWLAHALEQYETHAIIRPRARYVGAPTGAALGDDR